MRPSRLAVLVLASLLLLPRAAPAPAAPATPPAFAPMSDLIGFGSSGESFGEYPRTFPRLKELGVHWVRMFPEWADVQPKEGQWNWSVADSLVATGRENGIKTLGVFCYFAPWSSSRDGDTRAFPVRDMRFAR